MRLRNNNKKAVTFELDQNLYRMLQKLSEKNNISYAKFARICMRLVTKTLNYDSSVLLKDFIEEDLFIMRPQKYQADLEGGLSSIEAAAYLNTTTGSLQASRCSKSGRLGMIPYQKIGRYVRYMKKDLDAYINKCNPSTLTSRQERHTKASSSVKTS